MPFLWHCWLYDTYLKTFTAVLLTFQQFERIVSNIANPHTEKVKNLKICFTLQKPHPKTRF